MPVNNAVKVRLESWLQVVVIIIALGGILLANESRVTRIEVLIETFLSRLERMERSIDEIVLKTSKR